nr:MAG TPA: hypothetical protein [Caudoviricetes sp.]
MLGFAAFEFFAAFPLFFPLFEESIAFNFLPHSGWVAGFFYVIYGHI